jgi:hypothetical protein
MNEVTEDSWKNRDSGAREKMRGAVKAMFGNVLQQAAPSRMRLVAQAPAWIAETRVFVDRHLLFEYLESIL